MDEHAGLYNSRILKVYVEYLEAHYPSIRIESLLEYAGITRHEIDDPAYWLSMRQIERFHEIMDEQTGDPRIPREAGRYSAIAKASGALRQYAIGFLTPKAAYWVVGKIASHYSRAQTFEVESCTGNFLKMVVTPKPGIIDHPYQCENRRGMFEVLPKIFTNELAEIEHPQCLHKGDAACVYLIRWKESSAMVWKRLRSYAGLAGPVLLIPGLFVFSGLAWGAIALSWLCLIGYVSWYAEYLANKELKQTIERQGNAARDLLDEMDSRYDNAMLMHEISGQASSSNDLRGLAEGVSVLLEQHLDFERGVILFSDSAVPCLTWGAGYGYSSAQEEILKEKVFSLAPSAGGILHSICATQQPVEFERRSDIEALASPSERILVTTLKLQSLLGLPIVSKTQTLGVLLLERKRLQSPLKKTDLNLLMAISSQIAIGTIKIISLDRIKASLSEKEILLKEVHHRVKNNMQVVSSLLNLQAAALPDERDRMLLLDSQHRIRTMALIHERLYQSENLTVIDFTHYAMSLVNELRQAYLSSPNDIRCIFDLEDVHFDLDHAIPCGLILNELISNALKYAFPAGTGTITVGLGRPADGSYTLIVQDDGIGFAESDHFDSLGLRLVKGLIEEQLDGIFDLKSHHENGTIWRIVFP